jgi:hypothetical protein
MLSRNQWWKKKSHHQKNLNCLRLIIHHRLNQRRLAILWQSKYRNEISRWKTKKMISFFRRNKSLNKENNFSFRKNNFLCSHSSKLSNKLFEIENALLNVLTSKNINFWINVINIVQEKRVRKFSKDFANTTWINEKMKKIFIFHTTLMIVFNTKASKFEIKTTSSFKFHISNLSKSSLH